MPIFTKRKSLAILAGFLILAIFSSLYNGT